MKFGLDVPTTGEWADVRLLANLAAEADAHGWDGFFVYDQVAENEPVPLADPWIALTAVALATTRLRFGTLVTPLPRRRPWKLAREVATLDHLSGGRMVLGVGSGGGAAEFDNLGEAREPRVRALQLDEGLAILNGLWSGEPFSRESDHYHVHNAHFLPRPVQQPRVPIWVGGIWPNKAPMRRAARWDGVFPHYRDGMMPVDELQALCDFMRAERDPAAGSFDVALRDKLGDLPAADVAPLLRDYAAAGLTWWLEGTERAPTPDAMRARIRRGPPRVG
jgi:alkanesulfonate monooxygenase SsuD/methylene tetrahydromethanopterin reductase-like flavin-dependent oxidoreductase (luciferase family)